MRGFLTTTTSTIFLLFPVVVFAQTYTLMEQIGGSRTSPSLTQYLQDVVQAIIGLAGILAVIMIVVCGIKLLGSPSASARNEAKECIWNAIFGLLLAIGGWILLYTINPLLLSNEINLTNVSAIPTAATPAPQDERRPTTPGWYFKSINPSTGKIIYRNGGATKETCDALKKADANADPEGCFVVERKAETVIGDEAAVRRLICGDADYEKNKCVNATPVGINKLPCPYVNYKGGCTSVAGLPGSAVDVVKAIQSACRCNVVITGGTEEWLHKTHKAGRPIFDLRKSPQVDNYITSNGRGKRASFNGYTRIFLNDFWWTSEGDHWHVCAQGEPFWFCQDCLDKTCTKRVPP